MRQLIHCILSSFLICSALSAGDVEDVKNSIKNSFKYLNKMKKSENDYSKDGALEFWSSGGLMQNIDPSGRPETYDYVNINPKHIEVIVLAKGKAAVAMYYSEGNMKLKNSSASSRKSVVLWPDKPASLCSSTLVEENVAGLCSSN